MNSPTYPVTIEPEVKDPVFARESIDTRTSAAEPEMLAQQTAEAKRQEEAMKRFLRRLARVSTERQLHRKDAEELARRSVKVAERDGITRTRAVSVAMAELDPELSARAEDRRKSALVEGLVRVRTGQFARTNVKRGDRCPARGCRGKLVAREAEGFSPESKRDRVRPHAERLHGQIGERAVFRCDRCGTSSGFTPSMGKPAPEPVEGEAVA